MALNYYTYREYYFWNRQILRLDAPAAKSSIFRKKHLNEIN
jgi:hypothetical protein